MKLSTVSMKKNILIFLIILTLYITYILTHIIAINVRSYVNSNIEFDLIVPVFVSKEIPSDSIYFLETSSKGGVNSRQACCVESAARSNPRRQINLIFIGMVAKNFTESAAVESLLQYKNVRILRTHSDQLVKGTPVESLFARNELSKSMFPVEHLSDVLRIVLLYKYGGVYLDTDVITTKSFDTLPKNWLAKESEEVVNQAILSFSKDEMGRNFTTTALLLLNATYNPSAWASNGQSLMYRILGQMCDTNDVKKMNETSCPGIAVFSPKNFYPVPWWNSTEYFQPDSKNRIMDEPYTYHFNNRLTKNVKISNDSLIAKLARKFCPYIFNSYKDDFGI